MSMLTFYINRAGKNLPTSRREMSRSLQGRAARPVRPLAFI